MRSSSLPSADSNGDDDLINIETAFGSNSLIFSLTTERLSNIFSQSAHTPPVAARFREWQRCREKTHAQGSLNESLFIHQTYIALLARLIARRFVAPSRPIVNDEELREIINVDYFSRRGIGNFGEGGIFSWLILDPRWGLGLDELVIETARYLAEGLSQHDFTNAQPGILNTIYRQAAPSNAPVMSWVADHVVIHELGMKEDPSPSLLDPYCGTGDFLSAAIRAVRQGISERKGDEFDLIFDAPEKIRGIDRDPLAVEIARVNYLLALGQLVQEEHPQFLMPIYLADASVQFRPVSNDDSVITLSTSEGDFLLPAPFIQNPLLPDWVLGRITNYMDGAQLRLHVQPEEVAIQEVLNAYYNYLTAPKPRTPVPDALTPRQADVLLETARRLVELHIRGEGTLWLHLVQNMAGPAILSHRCFDRLAYQGPTSIFDIYSDIYLRSGGQAAIVTSEADAQTPSSRHRMLTSESRFSGATILLCGL